MGITDGIGAVFSDAKQLFNSPLAAAAGGVAAGSLITGAVALGVASSKKRRSRSSTKRRKTSKKTKKRKYKYARTAGKGKDRSTKRIRMTKTGQPYIILASGKARFIKKSSARNSRRRKGGRY